MPAIHSNKSIRSYALRRSRLTKGQSRALKELLPVYGTTSKHFFKKNVTFESIFGRIAPIHLDIGFGDGCALIKMAKNAPKLNFVGVEVYRPGVGQLLLKISKEKIFNVRVFCEDGIDVLKSAVCDGELSSVSLFFPDPWHKKKHQKRRILQLDVIQLIYQKLSQGGKFYFATDWEPYALEAIERLESLKGWINCAGSGKFSDKQHHRPLTKFELRGQRLGYKALDVIMQKKF